ncbi:MAG TPA: AmmeMemoRadiSam system protein A [Pyrinomonadaceae bacterium]|nr:AmmeMemoRadiSam system protein A [Pyrinomonadaceae bacterium]
MGNESPLVFSAIAPHPPIMVPEVGRDAISEVRQSIAAMEELTKRIISNNAETVILISPHAPLEPYAFVAYQDKELHGDFANFRAPDAQLSAPLDQELLSAIAERSNEETYTVVGISQTKLDHGSAVPLYFLLRNGWRGRVVALGYSFLSNEDHLRFGSCIGKAIRDVGRPVALVASGDLSHRLKPDAPAGYNPTAYIFDDEVVDALRSNNPDRIVKINQNLRELAGECGYRSMLIAVGATKELPLACEVLSYEAPFGVGYLVAQLTSRKTVSSPETITKSATVEGSAADGETLPALARAAVEQFVRDGRLPDPPQSSSELLQAHAACFVSLKTLDGDLRGCIGTIEPAWETLGEEIIANAINAATRDPRFAPVASEELANLRYSVDVLSATEPAEIEDLDPTVYGVIVEDEAGVHRGLLLPALEGIDTAERQVEIAARKAGILPGTPLRLMRFSVSRYKEKRG